MAEALDQPMREALETPPPSAASEFRKMSSRLMRREPAVKQTRSRKQSASVLIESTLEEPGRRVTPTVEDIRERAYFIYLNRCASGVPGDAHSDWLQAQAEFEHAPAWRR